MCVEALDDACLTTLLQVKVWKENTDTKRERRARGEEGRRESLHRIQNAENSQAALHYVIQPRLLCSAMSGPRRAAAAAAATNPLFAAVSRSPAESMGGLLFQSGLRFIIRPACWLKHDRTSEGMKRADPTTFSGGSLGTPQRRIWENVTYCIGCIGCMRQRALDILEEEAKAENIHMVTPAVCTSRTHTHRQQHVQAGTFIRSSKSIDHGC